MLRVQRSSPLSLGVTKPLCPLPPVTSNTIQYICQWETSPTLLNVRTEMVYFQWPFSQFQRVILLFLFHHLSQLTESYVASKKYQAHPEYAKFIRQLYHACLARIFEPLQAGMSTPELV
jgi:hypothetical protein